MLKVYAQILPFYLVYTMTFLSLIVLSYEQKSYVVSLDTIWLHCVFMFYVNWIKFFFGVFLFIIDLSSSSF